MHTIKTTDHFAEWFKAQDSDTLAAIRAAVVLLKERGPKLGRPHADTLNDSFFHNMKELRTGTATKVIRIAFAFDPEKIGILLTGGDKAGVNEKAFYKKLIDKADEEFQGHLEGLKADKEQKKKKS